MESQSVSAPLSPGPAMDAALCELLGITPKWALRDGDGWLSTAEWRVREHAEEWRQGQDSPDDWELALVYPPLSTTDAGMGVVYRWLITQGWGWTFQLCHSDDPFYSEKWWCLCHNGRQQVMGGGATSFEAVARAALATKGERG